MSFIKNPIILAIVMSAIVFLLLTYFCTEDEKEKDKEKEKGGKNKKKKKQDKLSRESIIIISVITGLGTWYLVSYWVDGKESKSEDKLDNGNKNQTGGSLLEGRGLSEDSTRSYNLIGSGLNIPRSELKLPKVLIDYQ